MLTSGPARRYKHHNNIKPRSGRNKIIRDIGIQKEFHILPKGFKNIQPFALMQPALAVSQLFLLSLFFWLINIKEFIDPMSKHNANITFSVLFHPSWILYTYIRYNVGNNKIKLIMKVTFFMFFSRKWVWKIFALSTEETNIMFCP